MLAELQIENFVLIRKEKISFSRGLNIISGASGAGKTIIVRALKLLAGERAASDLIGPFGDRAAVEGFFCLDPELLARALEDAAPLARDDNGELAAARTIDASGDNRCYLNGRAVTLQSFRQVMEPLMEISGQDGLSALAAADERAVLLDRYGRCEDLREEFAAALHEARALRRRLETLRAGTRDRRDRADLLRFQIGEIQALNLEHGETARLEEEHRLLGSLEQVQEALSGGRRKLYEGEESAADQIGAVLKSLAALPVADQGRIADCAGLLSQALDLVQEAAFGLRDLQEELNADPERLAAVEQRLSDLHAVLRRYGPTEADLFSFLDRVQAEYADINVSDDDLAALEERLAALAGELAAKGRRLNQGRARAGIHLAKEVDAALHRLHMREARFGVGLDDANWDDLIASASPSGPSPVRFLAATSPGARPTPIERTASGGERSRILLALLGALGRCVRIPSMVFDEIDENVGSRLGAVVADLLAHLARDMQIIAVTHLPAIAARGGTHHKVEKSVSRKETLVRVRALRGEERVRELAEMLAGPSPPEGAVAEAAKFLEQGRIEQPT